MPEDALLNVSHTREYILKMLAAVRPHLAGKMTRVSEETLVRLDARLRSIIVREIEQMPTVGKTIKF